VALVYNLKREPAEEISNEDRGEVVRETSTIVVAETKFLTKRSDTYAEWDTEETINAVRSALEQRHIVTLIEADEACFEKFRQVQPEIVFNIAEGMRGPSREAQIPAMLEMLGIPYTGSDPLTLGICLDKSRAKEILSYYGIATPPFAVITTHNDLESVDIPLPCIVKPLHEGSSKGIFNSSVVRTIEELHAQVTSILGEYNEPALIEQFLPGREFTVAMLGNEPNPTVLPIVEICFDSLPEGVNPIYSYEAKWIWDQRENPIDVHQCPAKIDSVLEGEIQTLCRNAFRVLQCRDWCRIDVRLDAAGKPHIIELNPLPGILPDPEEHSCFPLAARTAGISYQEMLLRVLDAAILRTGLQSATSEKG
jgi:D-alanine-D-alanine ligase